MPRGPYWQSSLDMEGMGPWDGAIVPDYLAYKGDPLVFSGRCMHTGGKCKLSLDTHLTYASGARGGRRVAKHTIYRV